MRVAAWDLSRLSAIGLPGLGQLPRLVGAIRVWRCSANERRRAAHFVPRNGGGLELEGESERVLDSAYECQVFGSL